MSEYKLNLWKFYIASILGGFAFFYNGVDTLYYRHFNLSFEQIGFLISTMLLATLFLEIPTGSFADIYGKKKSIIVGSVFVLIGLGFLAFGNNFNMFAIGFLSMGIGRAFNSGAGSALLYDFLHSMNKEHEYLIHQSRMHAAFVAIDIISSSLGFLLFAVNVRIPFYISFIAMALVILVQLTIKEALIERVFNNTMLITHLNQMKEGLRLTFKSKILLWFAGFTLIYFVTAKYFGEIVSLPFFRETKGFTIDQLVIMGLIWNTIQTATIFFISHIEKKLGQNLSILTIVALTPTLILGLLLSSNYLISALIIGLFWGTASFREIIIESYLNKHVNSNYRATVLSINSMILSILSIFILPLLGNYVDKSGLTNGMILLAILTLVFGVVFLGLKRST